MKGYLASMLAIADKAAQADLKEPLKLSISYDEEIGCIGIKNMLNKLGPSIGMPRACFVGEPTEMQVAIGHKGKAAFRATCYGQSGHSALAPFFTNSINLASNFVQELQSIQKYLARFGNQDEGYNIPYTTLHVGKLSAGTALNIVPDMAELIFEYRHLVADDPNTLERKIQQAADNATAPFKQSNPNAKIEIEKYNSYPGLDVSEQAEITTLAKSLAQSNSVTKVAFGTESGYFSTLGIPTVVCGPGSMKHQGHKPDEYITLAQLAECDAMMDRILKEISNT